MNHTTHHSNRLLTFSIVQALWWLSQCIDMSSGVPSPVTVAPFKENTIELAKRFVSTGL